MPELRLLAWPAGHSLSPRMHNAALSSLGLPHTYRAVAVPPEELAEAVRELRSEGVLGANVTVPHKEAVMPLLDELTDAATRIGAVNTIVRRSGRLVGDNTDAYGFEAALSGAGFALPGDRSVSAVVLGAGGSARAVVHALAPHARITLVNRTVRRAEQLAADFAASADIRVAGAGHAALEVRSCDLLVNTTSVGMSVDGVDPDASPLDAGELPSGAFVQDLVYSPPETRLLRLARERGLRCANGLEMLVRQGARAFELWTSESAPLEVMRAAIS